MNEAIYWTGAVTGFVIGMGAGLFLGSWLTLRQWDLSIEIRRRRQEAAEWSGRSGGRCTDPECQGECHTRAVEAIRAARKAQK